ncbi:TetR/AcrR family transcriptional regulator [Actinoplanes sp. KI2]|uniref:TetR/AcrR family transcriptional regulator n=1 Tax=Actinoplanes sp. KI2 TaxID=2983315 RepID=UPI0021D5EA1F|nr:TetR/AcrR family transcriptional regulator [Actinoplanes sp. KI2]MCU7725215.1 TetR/AcrR family transcriptional regulator [Actinoplanes sp. KI2]
MAQAEPIPFFSIDRSRSGIGSACEVITVSESERRPGARSDAQRNRQRIIDAATRAFTTGPDPVKIETIAHEAGVGVGTLYRNFPSREALVEEVYRSELTRLCAMAEHLVATHPPVDAMREWMRRYQDFVATKHGMAEALRAVIASGAIGSGQTRERLDAAIATILEAGRTDGSLRADVQPTDVSASMAGIMLTAADVDQATRMLQLLVDGLLARAPS